ncbi:hypothetical protein [Streptomyces sp. NPDC014746]
MTRSKRFLAGLFLAAVVTVGTTSPATANVHITSGPTADALAT